MSKIGGTYNFGEEVKLTRPKYKKVRMNFDADKPTLNGRIYTKESLELAFRRGIERKTVPIVRNCQELYEEKGGFYNPIVRMSDIIGIFKDFEIRESGETYIIIQPVLGNTDLFDLFHVSPCFLANVREDKTVEMHGLIGFFLVGGEEILELKK